MDKGLTKHLGTCEPHERLRVYVGRNRFSLSNADKGPILILLGFNFLKTPLVLLACFTTSIVCLEQILFTFMISYAVLYLCVQDSRNAYITPRQTL